LFFEDQFPYSAGSNRKQATQIGKHSFPLQIAEHLLQLFRKELKILKHFLNRTWLKIYLRNYLQKTKEELGFNRDSIVLLFFGYVRKYKGLDILIDAFPNILSEIPEARLLIVGEFYDKPDPYIEQIKKLGIEGEVKVINEFVSNEEVEKYYEVSDVVILPYRSATQSGILNVAYGFKKPVIVTDVGGLAEFVEEGKTGFVIKPDSPNAIVEGVKNFLNRKNEVDFVSHINELNKKNRFNQLPEVITQIIDDK